MGDGWAREQRSYFFLIRKSIFYLTIRIIWNDRELVEIKINRSIKKKLAFSHCIQKVTEYSKWTNNGDLLLGIVLQNKSYQIQLKQIHQLSVKDMVINGHFFISCLICMNTEMSQANHSKEVCLSPQHRKCVELNCTPAGFQLIHKKYPGHLFLLKWRRSISRFEATKWIQAWWESWILWKQVFNVSMTDGNKVLLYIYKEVVSRWLLGEGGVNEIGRCHLIRRLQIL